MAVPETGVNPVSPSGTVQDVVIVGGGAIGVAAAFELADRGASVSLLERELDVARGCSYGNCGLIVPSHATPLQNPHGLREGIVATFRPRSPLYIRPRPSIDLVRWLAGFAAASMPARSRRAALTIRDLSLLSRERHVELAERVLGRSTLTRAGILNVYETPSLLAAGEREAEHLTCGDLGYRVVRDDALHELEPMLSRDVAGGIFYESDAHCDSYEFVSALADAARARGAVIHNGCEVLRLNRAGARLRVETTRGSLEANTVILAAGVWSPALARQVGIRLPIQAAKGYHVDLGEGDTAPRAPMLFARSKVAVTPLAGRVRIGGTFELAGLDLAVTHARVRALVDGARRYLPALACRPTQGVWRGLRPCTPDGLPVVGPARSEPRLIVAAGHGMMGLTLAPITGMLVAELVTGKPTSFPVGDLRVDRFRV